MGYLFAMLALLAGATKGYCGKRTSGRVSSGAEAMLANCVRMVLCVVIGFVLLAVQGQLPLLLVEPQALLIMVASGVTTAVFVVSWIVAVKRSAFMLLDVFLLMGVLVPMLLCQWFYNEVVTLPQWCGIALLAVAVLIMCSYNTSVKGKLRLGDLGLLALSGLANGLSDFSLKSYTHFYADGSAAVFNFYTYVFSAIVLAICYFVFRRRTISGLVRPPKEILLPIMGYVTIMAVCLFANSYFKVMATGYLTAAQLFPLMQGLGIALATGMSAVFFKERITLRCVIGVILSFAALLIINLL